MISATVGYTLTVAERKELNKRKKAFVEDLNRLVTKHNILLVAQGPDDEAASIHLYSADGERYELTTWHDEVIIYIKDKD